MEKERLDILLVEKGFFKSREKARASIMAGVVYINNQKEIKPGTKFPVESNIEVRNNVLPYVSRGGLKLEKAINTFKIDLKGKTAMDIGSSTGGFTDCMLQNGAVKVYSIDVGYGQLAWELRNDPRVVCMERTNIRYVKPEDLEETPDFASIDVSFISLKKVLPVVKELLNENGQIICLIKPQFEAGREKVGKHGVVREAQTHKEVIEGIVLFSYEQGFQIIGLDYSPIKGPEGNIEYLLYISKIREKNDKLDFQSVITDVVERSHSEL